MCSGKPSYQAPLASAAATSFSTIGRRAASNATRAFAKEASSVSALLRAMASSIARRVPEPMEKCAVRSASPISTVLATNQRRLRRLGKFRQTDLLDTSRWPKSVSRYFIVRASSVEAKPPSQCRETPTQSAARRRRVFPRASSCRGADPAARPRRRPPPAHEGPPPRGVGVGGGGGGAVVVGSECLRRRDPLVRAPLPA